VVELVENFVEELWLSRFLLVGGSMGGLVALLYAEQNPDKIAGFVNVEGNLAPTKRSILPLPLQFLSFTLITEEFSLGLGMWLKILLRHISTFKDLGVKK
jgi:pimeloyl-ACP methyl ester carboxylesterase